MRLNLGDEMQRLTKKPAAMGTGPRPGDVLASAAASTGTFAVVSACTGLAIRHHDFGLSVFLVVLVAIFVVGLLLGTYKRYQQEKMTRPWLVTTVCAAAGLAFGWWLGDKRWFGYGIPYFQYNKMASYVNLDPMTDKGAAYMDAGTVYFKEHSMPALAYAMDFENGQRYCVAPILRNGANTAYELPQTGSVDFWAVGTDCCDEGGKNFTCGDIKRKRARTGIRVLDANERDGYLLAVQQFSSKASVPVRHPLFFYWVKDPLKFRDDLMDTAEKDYWVSIIIWAAALIPVSYLLNMLLDKAYGLF